MNVRYGRRQPRIPIKAMERKCTPRVGHTQTWNLPWKHIIVNAAKQWHMRARNRISELLTSTDWVQLNLQQHLMIQGLSTPHDRDRGCCPDLAEATANIGNTTAAHLCSIQSSSPNSTLFREQIIELEKEIKWKMWLIKSVWIRDVFNNIQLCWMQILMQIL